MSRKLTCVIAGVALGVLCWLAMASSGFGASTSEGLAGTIICGEREVLNDAGDRCELMPEEDEPGWDCAIHGNGICGPGAEWRGSVVGDVIVCPEGLTVATDVSTEGVEWAACM